MPGGVSIYARHLLDMCLDFCILLVSCLWFGLLVFPRWVLLGLQVLLWGLKWLGGCEARPFQLMLQGVSVIVIVMYISIDVWIDILTPCDATNDSFVCEEKCVFVSVYVADVFFISCCCSSQSKNWQSFSYLGTENYSLLLDLLYRRTSTVLYRFGCLRSRWFMWIQMIKWLHIFRPGVVFRGERVCGVWFAGGGNLYVLRNNVKKMQLKLVVANSGPEGYVPRSTLARVLDKVYQTSLNVWIFGIAG